jgi:hypothetical protein
MLACNFVLFRGPICNLAAALIYIKSVLIKKMSIYICL